jgi:hypothetical protein
MKSSRQLDRFDSPYGHGQWFKLKSLSETGHLADLVPRHCHYMDAMSLSVYHCVSSESSDGVGPHTLLG